MWSHLDLLTHSAISLQQQILLFPGTVTELPLLFANNLSASLMVGCCKLMFGKRNDGMTLL